MIKCERPITRRLEFDAGHRVLGHEGKCACLHGHRYAAEITVQAKKLDQVGRVIDFSCIKERVGSWIDKHWDHNMILHKHDPLVAIYRHPAVVIQHGVPSNENREVRCGDVFNEKMPYVMPGGRNPTAEEMAYELYTVCVVELPVEIDVINVRIYETPNCWADFTPLPEFSP